MQENETSAFLFKFFHISTTLVHATDDDDISKPINNYFVQGHLVRDCNQNSSIMVIVIRQQCTGATCLL